MRVLITGAGLIGTHTAKELIERGDEVTFFDFAPRPDYIRHVTGRDLPVIRGDIRDLAALVDAFQQVRPECVIHLAASVGEANINNVYAGFQVIWSPPSTSLKRRGSRACAGWSTPAPRRSTSAKIRMSCFMRIRRSTAGSVSTMRRNSAANMCCEPMRRNTNSSWRCCASRVCTATIPSLAGPGVAVQAGGMGCDGRKAGDAQCLRERRFHLCQGSRQWHCAGRAYVATASTRYTISAAER